MRIIKDLIWIYNNYYYSTLIFLSIVFLVVFYLAYRWKIKIDNQRLEIEKEKTTTIKQNLKSELKLKGTLTDEDLKKIRNEFDNEEKSKLYKNFNHLFHSKKKWGLLIKDFLLNRFRVNKILLIDMELTNGFHRTFLIQKRKDNSFKFQGKRYILSEDPSLKYYNLNAKLYCLNYYEGYSLPFRKKLNYTRLREGIERDGRTSTIAATNPLELENYTDSKVLEALMKGGKLLKEIKQFKMVLLAILIIAGIHLMLFIHASGVLTNMQFPV